jgi:hypothetical protein
MIASPAAEVISLVARALGDDVVSRLLATTA